MSGTYHRSIVRSVRVVALWCAIEASSLFAQVLPFHTYTTKDGLISNRILTIYQDFQGYVWIGTADGISVFDGATFRNYSPAEGLSGSYATSIIESKHAPGTMWIGTFDGGLNKFENGTFTTIDIGQLLPSPQVSNLLEDREGTLWCSTARGVYRVHNNAVEPFQHKDLADGVVGIVDQGDSLICVVGLRNIVQHSLQTGISRSVPLELPMGVTAADVYRDPYNDLWVSASDGTLLRMRDSKVLYRRQLAPGKTYLVSSDQEDLWFGALPGLGRMKMPDIATHEPLHYTIENGLPDNNIFPHLVDREGNIWFGTWDNGLVKLSDKTTIRFPCTVFDSKVAVIVDDRKRWWVLANDGAYEIWMDRSGRWNHAAHHITSSKNKALKGQGGTFLDGLLWIAFADGSISCYRPIPTSDETPSTLLRVRTIDLSSHFLPDEPFGFFIDGKKRLWCVAGGSMVIVDVTDEPQVIGTFGSPPLPKGAFINVMWQDRRGNMWLGDYNSGLLKIPFSNWRSDTMKLYTTADGLPDTRIRSLAEDGAGRLWVGTRYGGVALFDGERFTTLSSKDGLLSNHIRSLTLDRTGLMWLGTSLGLMYIDPLNPKRFGWKSEFLGTQVNACGIHPDGYVWFATQTGLTISRLPGTESPISPPVYVTSFTVNGTPVNSHFTQNLLYDQNNCVISFVGISFTDEKAIRYQYRLRGIDLEWSDPISQRSVTYPSLTSGEYTFEVKAINAGGIASEIPAVVAFTIQSPVWQRWWFVAVFAVVMVGLSGGAARYFSVQKLRHKVRELEKEQAVQQERFTTRERIASDLHDDVATTLGSIALFAESLKRDLRSSPTSTQNLVHKIDSLLGEAQDAVSDIMWTTAPEHDTLKDLLWRIRDLGSEICTNNNLACNMDIGEGTELPLDEETRRNIYLIFKEALSNVVKHARAKSVVIEASLSDDMFRLTIRDDGVGISHHDDADPSDAGRGHGLRNMKRRAEQIGAQFSIASTLGQGTTVHLLKKMT